MLRIKLVKSPIANTPRNRATVAALGLRRMNQVVEHADTPTIRGLVHHVKHLLAVEEVEGERKAQAKTTPKKAASKKAAAVKAAPAKQTETKPKATKAAASSETEEAKPKRTTKKKSETAEEK